MEEEATQNPVSQEEFEEKLQQAVEANNKRLAKEFAEGTLFLRNFAGVGKFKSIRRAIRRGRVSLWGDVYPNKPYNNRKSHKKSINSEKRRLYEQLITKGNI